MFNHQIVGFTAGTFDLYHTGHARLLQHAKALCDRLIVGVLTDACVLKLKNVRTVMSFEERSEIIQSNRHVNLVVPCHHAEHSGLLAKLKFDLLFIGDDWFDKTLYHEMEEQFGKSGVKTIFLPRTEGISTTSIKERIC